MVIFRYYNHNSKIINNKEFNISKNISEEVIQQNKFEEKNYEVDITKKDIETINWYIEIPAINLKAPIEETTNIEVLNNYVGHFEETSKTRGNIGLAGHNRGYKNNYFENLHKLKKGDEIKYQYFEFEKQYYVEKIEIIKNTNWSYLEKTDQNKITLITCVENKPDLRLCIQAIQK